MVAPPLPGRGRVFTAGRRVRLGDALPCGRLRLDALARYLQDVAADDVAEAGFPDEARWVVRTTHVEVHTWPVHDQVIEVVTWCSATGPAWAERRTTVRVGGRPAVDTVSTWVSLDPVTLRPAPLTERFAATYLSATAGRTVRSRLVHPGPHDAALERRWALRAVDYDLLGHVNNAVAWVAVEDELARRGVAGRVVAGQVEYRSSVEAAADLAVRSIGDDDELRLWLLGSDGRAAISAVVQLGSPPGAL